MSESFERKFRFLLFIFGFGGAGAWAAWPGRLAAGWYWAGWPAGWVGAGLGWANWLDLGGWRLDWAGLLAAGLPAGLPAGLIWPKVSFFLFIFGIGTAYNFYLSSLEGLGLRV